MANGGPDSRVLIGALHLDVSKCQFFIFDARHAELLASHDTELHRYFPHDGWVEQDPMEYVKAAKECIQGACQKLQELGHDVTTIRAVGIANQRETAVVWDGETGQPLHNAIVSTDERTQPTIDRLLRAADAPGDVDFLRRRCGLPLTTRCTAPKLVWLTENDVATQEAVKGGRCLAGTCDSWLIWCLTAERRHVTDVTNASRTMLMNIHSCQWDDSLLRFFGIQREMLPEIRSSAEVYGTFSHDLGANFPLAGVPIAALLGDKQAGMVGHQCFSAGAARYSFDDDTVLMVHTGNTPIESQRHLYTTIAYQFGDVSRPTYALEGFIPASCQSLAWLRDSLHLVSTLGETEELVASSTPATAGIGGVHLVPAFSGLRFPPYNDSHCGGSLTGISASTSHSDIARAALESVAFQLYDMLLAVRQDLKPYNEEWESKDEPLQRVIVDEIDASGVDSKKALLLQLLADVTGLRVKCQDIRQSVGLGAALAAASAVNVWHPSFFATSINSRSDLANDPGLASTSSGRTGMAFDKATLNEIVLVEKLPPAAVDIFEPTMSMEERHAMLLGWHDAVRACLATADTKRETRRREEDEQGDIERMYTWGTLNFFLMTAFGMLAMNDLMGPD